MTDSRDDSILTNVEIALRGLRWDTDDLEYTLNLIEMHPSRFLLLFSYYFSRVSSLRVLFNFPSSSFPM